MDGTWMDRHNNTQLDDEHSESIWGRFGSVRAVLFGTQEGMQHKIHSILRIEIAVCIFLHADTVCEIRRMD